MNRLGDRFVILLIGFVGLGSFIFAMMGGLIEAEAPSGAEPLLYGVLGLVLLAALVAVWQGFNAID